MLALRAVRARAVWRLWKPAINAQRATAGPVAPSGARSLALRTFEVLAGLTTGKLEWTGSGALRDMPGQAQVDGKRTIVQNHHQNI